ncbi:MAG: hypothetical protein D3912_06080 [Candidatus Electrothrix sp. AX1]|nr:hypothetical protein [Candidatus Electrothrix sp. AX1]
MESMKSDTLPSPRRTRLHRGILFSLFFCLMIFAGFFLALTTEFGFQLMLRTADSLSGPLFSVQEIQGKLFSDWRLGKVQVHVDQKVDVVLDELAFSWSPFLLFQKKLVVQQVAMQGLNIHLTGTEDTKEEKTSPVLLPTIALPVTVALEKIHLRDGQISFAENEQPLVINEVILQATTQNNILKKQEQYISIDLQRVKLDLRDYGVDLQGQIALSQAWPLELKGTWQVAGPSLSGNVHAQGDLDELALSLNLVAPAEATLQGQITDVLNDLHWQATAKTGHLQLRDMQVAVPVDGDLTVVEASGTTGSYRATLAAHVHYQGYPPMQAEAKILADDYTGLTVEYLAVHHEAARLTTRGTMHWSNGFSWQAELEGKQLDPSLFAKKWPGNIHGLIQTQGKLGASDTSLAVHINSLGGELVGFPLTGNGSMTLDRHGLQFDDLQLHAGSAQAQLDGRIAKDNSLDLIIRAGSDNLSTFFPEYAGKIHLHGTATGQQENPGINLVLKGSDLDVAGYTLSKLQADLAADLVLAEKASSMKINKLHLLLGQNKEDKQDMSLDATGQVGWGEKLSWQATLHGEQIDPGIFLSEWAGNVTTDISSQGEKKGEKITGKVQIEQLSGKLRDLPLSGSGQVVINDKRINVHDLKVQSGATQLVVQGAVQGQADEQQLDLTVQAQSDDLSSLFPELKGRVEITAEAKGTTTDPAITLSVHGQELAFQEYLLEDIQADAAADLIVQGDKQGASVKNLRLILNKKGEKSVLAATGQVGWGEKLSWQATLHGEQIDPGIFFPEWAGNITTDITSQGQKKGEEITGKVQIEQLSGRLRDLPLSGSGQVRLKDKLILLNNIRLGMGSGKVRIHGSADREQQLDLRFEAKSANFADLLPGTQGKLQLQGVLQGVLQGQGKGQQPDLHLTVKADNIQYADYQLKQLKGKIKANLSAQGTVAANIRASGLRGKEKEEISRLSLDVQGKTAQHTLKLALTGTSGQVQLVAAGGLKEQIWQGKLTQLSLHHKQFGAWTIPRPADLRLSSKDAALSHFQLQHKGAKMALDGSWRQKKGWQVKGAVKDLALNLLQEWQIPVPDIDGTVQIQLAAQGQGPVPDQAKLSVTVPKLSLITENFESLESLEDDRDKRGTTVWVWTDNTVEARLQGGTARLHAQTQFQDRSNAQLKVVVTNCTDFSQPDKMPLSGQLNLHFKDLSPLAQLTHEAVQATGAFKGRILLGGTVAKPTVNGKLALKKNKKEGEIFLTDAGIRLKDLQVAFAGNSHSNTVNATCSSGQGSIKLNGVVRQDAQQDWLADVVLSGKNFQAVDLPEYRATISPDLRLHYTTQATRLNGTVTLNSAEISPTGFGGAVSSSADIVVVDDEQPTKGTSPIELNLKVIMGKEVLINSFGLKGFLDGSLQIKATPGRPITALGNLGLRDGTFDFEGNMLKFSNGRIFYQGGPIDDPGLDIQASREVNKVALGVHLTGSANNMNMRLFSNTAMEQSEILSYLLTGQDISKSGAEDKVLSPAGAALGKVGGGILLKTVDPLKTFDMEGLVDLSIGGGEDASDLSLVMGKEIYKDLYISYGKNLTGEGGTFKARYDLKYGFSVETATNAKTSGADLLFSWEP